MNPEVAISVKNLTKIYRIFRHPGDRLKQALTFGQKEYHKEFTALKDVSFEIKKGETVGIIGGNGSGKSTLLQLICGILKPTSGSVTVKGRISALLELGAGFNPEFTGRENVYFQGAVMGIAREAMAKRFDEIAAFADIGEFIDQPVRVYSSGMFVRLAFAVAVHVEPDILVVDEALAVGDASFQRKCYARLESVSAQGCTIVMASHDADAIITHCKAAYLFDCGNLLRCGTPKDINDIYLARQFQKISFPTGDQLRLTPKSTLSYVPRGAVIDFPRITTLAGDSIQFLRTGVEYCFIFDVRFTETVSNVRYGMLIKTPNGRELGGLESAEPLSGLNVVGGMECQQIFHFRCNFLPGTYFLNAGVLDSNGDFLHRIIDATMFVVLPEENSLGTGVVDISSENCYSHANIAM